jgi:predicted metal-dependent HD superfamily phosphohydrolase
MISPERLDLMQLQWVRLLQPLNVDLVQAYSVFDRLVAAYSEPHRHYHTLEHLGEVFRVAGRLPCDNRLAVNLAIWFHDVVYDPIRNDNEEQSALFAERWLGELNLTKELIETVQQLIRATAHLDGNQASTLPDVVALLDADLAILGADQKRYFRYAADIRREYSHVPEDQYRQGRSAVLQKFLAHPAIYRSRLLQEEGEAAARRNLEAELQSLI